MYQRNNKQHLEIEKQYLLGIIGIWYKWLYCPRIQEHIVVSYCFSYFIFTITNTSIPLIHIAIVGGCSLLLAEAGLFVGVRRSIATHCNCINVWKILLTSLSQHLDRPNLPIPINSQWIILGRQANLKESSKSKELAEMRLQVLVVLITSDACASKKEIMRLREWSTK